MTNTTKQPENISRKRNVFDVIHHLQKINKTNENKKKNILIRVDFNVPMVHNSEENTSQITDDSRITAALPTIQAVLKAGFNAVLVSHMGRPKLVQKGEENDETKLQREQLSLKPTAARLSELLNIEVKFALDCVGNVAKEAIEGLPTGGGGVVVLENLRFYKGEEKNNDDFARSLASLADAYINDAFGTCHRAHASVTGVPKLLPKELCGLGCLVSSELNYLDFDSVEDGASVMALIGGSKVSTKLPVIQGILNQVDVLFLGGGLAFTFLKAKGIPIGNSLVEDSMLETAKELMATAKEKSKQIVLPIDAVCGQEFPSGPVSIDDTKTFDLVEGEGVEEGWSGFDVGPKTVDLFREKMEGCKKLVVNGPMGVFEMPPYDQGTRGIVTILEEITKTGVETVVGGGDSVAALEAFGKIDAVSYVSTGGGATLELLSGEILPGVAAISNAKEEEEDVTVSVKCCSGFRLFRSSSSSKKSKDEAS